MRPISALSLKHTIAESAENLVYLHISEGVGVGIICEGSLLRGITGMEVGWPLPLGNPRKYLRSECGAYGCIENELAIPDIVAEYWGRNRGGCPGGPGVNGCRRTRKSG